MTRVESDSGAARRICEVLLRYRRVVVTSTCADGDSIGSSLALAWALRAIGTMPASCTATPAGPARGLPGTADIEVGETVPAGTDAVVVLECGDLGRTGLAGFDGLPVINIDHHPGNTGYGDAHWFDGAAPRAGR